MRIEGAHQHVERAVVKGDAQLGAEGGARPLARGEGTEIIDRRGLEPGRVVGSAIDIRGGETRVTEIMRGAGATVAVAASPELAPCATATPGAWNERARSAPARAILLQVSSSQKPAGILRIHPIFLRIFPTSLQGARPGLAHGQTAQPVYCRIPVRVRVRLLLVKGLIPVIDSGYV